eukprot:TRINITY_DN9535_c0_g1_i2.p1 TRINITY_DN9535_c0_g1~~TRINITY_DN9535_c0_g1_i2.p1  ORF type:complete len:552 (-),score=61.14 TRINITY_DN9535_c0_g1_i2:65-1720(-)
MERAALCAALIAHVCVAFGQRRTDTADGNFAPAPEDHAPADWCRVPRACCSDYNRTSYPTYSECISTPYGWRPELPRIDENYDLSLISETVVYFRPEVKLIYQMLDKGSTFKVKFHIQPNKSVAARFGDSRLDSINMMTEYSTIITISNSNLWNLDPYPFDKRTLRWHWSLGGDYTSNVRIVPLNPVTLISDSKSYEYFGAAQDNILGHDVLPPGWNPNGVLTNEEQVYTSPADVNSVNGLYQALPIRRDWTTTGTATIFPCACCVLIGLAAMYVPISVAMPRFAGSVLPMLTLASIKRTVDQEIPLSAQGCLLSYWLSQSMGVLAMSGCVTLVGFRVKQDYGDTAQALVDAYYRPLLTGYYFTTFPLATLIGRDASYSFYMSVLPLAFLCLIPIPIIWYRLNNNSKFSNSRERSDSLKSNPDMKQDANPMCKGPKFQPPEFGDWLDQNISALFDRYDFNGNGILDDHEEIEQMSLNSFFALNTEFDSGSGYRLLTKMEDIETSIHEAQLPMTEPEFRAWFEAQISWVDKSQSYDMGTEMVSTGIGMRVFD